MDPNVTNNQSDPEAAGPSPDTSQKHALGPQLPSDAHRQGDDALRFIGDLETRLKQLRMFEAEQEEAQRELEERLALLDNDRTAIEQRASELAASEDALGMRDTELRSKARAIEAAAQELEVRQAELADRESVLAEQSRDLTAAGADARQVASLTAERDRLTQIVTNSKQEIARLRAEIDDRAATFERMVNERKLAQDALATAQSIDREQANRLTHRQRRLHNYRAALKARAATLRKARDIIRKKAHDAERVLKDRASLEQDKRATKTMTVKLRKRLARRDGGMLFALLAVGASSLGAMAWSAASRIAPATYVAQATIAPAVRQSSAVDQAQVASWREMILKLLEDPRLADVASQRMKRRGVTALASPAVLAQFFRVRLDVSIEAPDRVAVALREQGDARSRLLLDTTLAALVSLANDARRLGPSGLSTEVRDRPRTAAAVEDDRLTYALVIFAASLLPLLLLAWLIAAKTTRVAAVISADEAPLDF